MTTQKMQCFHTRGGGEVSINLLQVGAVRLSADGGTGCTLLVQGQYIDVQEEAREVVALIDSAFASFHHQGS